MATKNGNCGYIGRVPNSGAAVVQAPNQKTVKKNPTVHRGSDLRVGGQSKSSK